LEHVFKMEDLFKQIKQEDETKPGTGTQEPGA
jgi:hypothetical protein